MGKVHNLPVPSKDGTEVSVAFYDAACEALDQAARIDEVKEIHDKAMAMQIYAKQAKNVKLSRNATEIRLRAEKKIGVKIKEQREAGELAKGAQGSGSNQHKKEVRVWDGPAPPTLASLGIDKHLADRSRKAAAMSEEKYEAKLVRQLALAEKAASMTGKPADPRSEHSGEIEWYTPSKYIELAREVMGGIDLDPASSDAAQTVVQAKKYFTIKDDGLTKDWHGRVWMNPPYKHPMIAHFVNRLIEQAAHGNTKQAVMVVNNSTDTEWFQCAAHACSAICFTAGRIKFENREHQEQTSPTQGQAFLYFGSYTKEFERVFGTIGIIVWTT